jgi:hypothetical protein
VSDLQAIPHRDGSTYEHARDARRLAGQHARIFSLMKDGCWRTLQEIAAHTNDGEASISARLRDFRKERFGSHTVEREHLGDGLFRYRLFVNRRDLFQEI